MRRWKDISFKRFKLSSFLCALSLIILCACGGNNGRVLTPTKPTQPLYKHTLSLLGDPRTVRAFAQNFNQSALRDVATLSPNPDPDGLQLNLQLLSRVQDVAPRVGIDLSQPGRLGRKQVSPQHTLNYTLMGTDGRMITGGAAKATGKPQTVYVPALNNTLKTPTSRDINTLINTTAAELTPVIKAQQWRARVVAQQGLQHVVIAAGKSSGLTYGANLQTETLPLATLQVVTLDTTPEGQARASLRLIQGRLPTVGRSVIPLNLNN